MSEDIDGGVEATAPAWAVFGDLMSVLLGAFVLILVSVVAVQLQLSTQLEEEVKQRQEETHPIAAKPWSRRWRAPWPPAA